MSTQADPLTPVVLSQGATSIHVVPARGGIITRLRHEQRDFFYLDEATLLDATKNVRGGNPVLFPSPGKLTEDRWSRGGFSGALKQHGFARNLPWSILAQSERAIRLGLSSSEATLAVYPFAFEAHFTYTVGDGSLDIEMHFHNRGAHPMPFGAGFHPYFAIPEAHKGQTTIETRARRAFDNVSKREVDFALDLAAGEVDLHLIDHDSSSARMQWPGGSIRLDGSPEFRRWVIWTLPGKDFVCLEPWTCPGDALNTGAGLIELAPGEARTLRLTMRCDG